MFNFIPKLLTLAVIFLPSATFAGTVDTLISAGFTWLSMLVYIVIGIAVILFFWGIIKYVIAGSTNEEGRRDGRNLIVYGIIGLFVMVAIWGLVYFLAGVLGIGLGGTIAVPDLPSPGGLPGPDSTLVTIIKMLGGWIARLAVLLIGFALVAFLWGVTKYIASGADEEKRTEARNLIVYGIVGLFAMVAIWGLVYFVGSTLGIDIDKNTVLTVPQIDNSIEILKAVPGAGGKPGSPAVSITGQPVQTCANARWLDGTKSFLSLICLVLTVLEPIPPILIALAVLYFFWGIAKYMNAGGDSEKLKEGRNTIIFGILGLFVIVAVWGLVMLVKTELGV